MLGSLRSAARVLPTLLRNHLPENSRERTLEVFTDSTAIVRMNAHRHNFCLDVSASSPRSRAEQLQSLGICTFAPNASESIVIQENEVDELWDFACEVRQAPTAARAEKYRIATDEDTYSSMEASDIAVVSLRDGRDNGMIDIFHADRLFALGQKVRNAILNSGVLDAIARCTGTQIFPSNLNFYLNESVTRTRGFHVDSYGGKQFKVFMYLTDVQSLDCGPYCYAPTSHALDGFESINRRCSVALGLKATDITLLPATLPIPVLGPRGTIIASNQSGAHRGYPQARGARRAIAALNCRVR